MALIDVLLKICMLRYFTEKSSVQSEEPLIRMIALRLNKYGLLIAMSGLITLRNAPDELLL